MKRLILTSEAMIAWNLVRYERFMFLAERWKLRLLLRGWSLRTIEVPRGNVVGWEATPPAAHNITS